MNTVRYPSLYQINTRAWLTELSRTLGRRATLDDIPDADLDRLAHLGFDWIWLLSVWQTGLASQRVSRSNPEWLKEFHETAWLRVPGADVHQLALSPGERPARPHDTGRDVRNPAVVQEFHDTVHAEHANFGVTFN